MSSRAPEFRCRVVQGTSECGAVYFAETGLRRHVLLVHQSRYRRGRSPEVLHGDELREATGRARRRQRNAAQRRRHRRSESAAINQVGDPAAVPTVFRSDGRIGDDIGGLGADVPAVGVLEVPDPDVVPELGDEWDLDGVEWPDFVSLLSEDPPAESGGTVLSRIRHSSAMGVPVNSTRDAGTQYEEE